MNVGSILNNDSPPSDKQKEQGSRQNSASSDIHQRNSIVSILNNPISETKDGVNNQRPPLAKPVKRNSIADITNEINSEMNSTKQEITNGKPKQQNQQNNKSSSSKSSKSPTPTKSPAPTSQGSKSSDELLRLKQLKSKKKPTRYTTPPIWAQEWIPPNQRHLQVSEVPSQDSSLSDKRVFDYSKTQSVDLECSITGVIPAPSITRTIAEWIFANFQDIADTNHKYVELELKFGTIMDKRKGGRININVATECVFTDHSNIRFDMQVEELAWNDMSKCFQELESGYQEELRKMGGLARNKPKRKFTMLESDITDQIYQIESGNNEHPKSVRVSKDNTLNPPRFVAIEKQRISSLYVHVPSSMYDLRLSLSLEIPIPENAVDLIMARNTPTLIREKKRNTWTHTPTVSQFDLTRVSIPRESKSKSGKKLIERDQNFEVEIEINTAQVFQAIEKFSRNVDPYRFEELVEIFMNNARVLNNRVTKLAYK